MNVYEGEKTIQFNVIGRDISKEIEVKVKDAVYTGEAREPDVTVTWNKGNTLTADDVVLERGTDYRMRVLTLWQSST